MAETEKARCFIGCSKEGLDIAYAIQESLEHEIDITVWPQGVFNLSGTTIDDLLALLGRVDFGIFIVRPDDVVRSRGAEAHSTRDNVVFEMGMFMGRLGKERTFIVRPRQPASLHLPTDLLGLTVAEFSEDHSGGLQAALGPACNKVRKAIAKLGRVGSVGQVPPAQESVIQMTTDDYLAILTSWIGNVYEPHAAIRFSALDISLGLPPGTAKQFLPVAARRYEYVTVHQGADTILLEDDAVRGIGVSNPVTSYPW